MRSTCLLVPSLFRQSLGEAGPQPGRELEAAKGRLERELSRTVFGVNGQQLTSDPGIAQMRRDQGEALLLLADEISKLKALEGEALRRWASDQGYQ